MACNYSFSFDSVIPIDPTNTNIYYIRTDITDFALVAGNNFTTSGGRTAIVADITSRIESSDGVADTVTVSYNAGTQTATFVIEYHYEDGAVGADSKLSALSIEGITFVGAEVECDGEPEPAEECSSCEELTLPACQDQYTITAGLTPNTDYVVVITGQQGREYVQDVTSDNVGDITISADNLPDGLTTPEQSPLQLVVRGDDGADQTITNNNTTYPCVNLNFVYQESVTSIINLLIITDDYGNPIQDDLNNNIDIG